MINNFLVINLGVIGGACFIVFLIIIVKGLYEMDSEHQTSDQLVQNLNNTKFCSDIKFLLEHLKDNWVHAEIYDKYSNLYQYLNCDEVLKK